MARVTWDAVGDRKYEAGVDRGVLYLSNSSGVPWNGLVGVTEKKIGGETSSYYLDGIKYAMDQEPEDFAATIEAYTYPDEFMLCDGTFYEDNGLGFGQQPRESFGLSYRSMVGNDIEGLEYGYKIHLIYNALASPSDRTNGTLTNDPSVSTFTWDLETIPLRIPGYSQTAHLIIDSTKAQPYVLNLVEKILYGSPTTAPRFPSGSELVKLFKDWEAFGIQSNTVTGLSLLDATAPNNDLSGDFNEGLYTAAPGTRLKTTTTPGLYRLD